MLVAEDYESMSSHSRTTPAPSKKTGGPKLEARMSI